MHRFRKPQRWVLAPANRSLLGLAAFLVIPSVGEVEKYLGAPGLGCYLVLVPVVLLVPYRRLVNWFLVSVTNAQAVVLAVVTLASVAVAFAVVYPIADSGVVGGGTDRDEALDIAARELLHGRYLYGLDTDLGNPISPMPGAVLLAVPFVLMGNSAYQVFLWLPVFVLVLARLFGSLALALVLLWTILIVAPAVPRDIVIGSDHLSNSLYVFIFSLVMVRTCATTTAVRLKALSAALLGLGLSSRANFVLVLPLVFSQLVRDAGWKDAARYTSITCGTLAAVILPFYLYAPQDFSPLHVAGRLDSTIPHTFTVVLALVGAMTLAFALRSTDGDYVALFRRLGLLQASLVLADMGLRSWDAGAPMLDNRGVLFLAFGALAFFHDVAQREWGRAATV